MGFFHAAGLLQGLVGTAPQRVGALGGRAVGAGIGIEQLAHRFGLGQPLPGMLAMDIDQRAGNAAQLRGGGRHAIDPELALALRIDHAAQQQGFFARHVVVAEKAFQRGGRIELGHQLGAAGALAHKAGVGAVPQHQLQCIDQDRFTGARLARQGREAGLEIYLQLLDDDEITQANASEAHGVMPPSFQPSFLRKVA